EVNPNAVEQSSKPVTTCLTEAGELESYIAIREARAALLLRVNAATKEVSEQTSGCCDLQGIIDSKGFSSSLL
nr:pre-mRNA-processing factor 39 isoform X1 [Tanacetum cinerariifolium]